MVIKYKNTKHKKYNNKSLIPIQIPLKVCPGGLVRLRKICILQSPFLLRKKDRKFVHMDHFVSLCRKSKTHSDIS